MLSAITMILIPVIGYYILELLDNWKGVLIFIISIILGISFMWFVPNYCRKDMECVLKDVKSIRSLQDNTTIQGNFSLGSGTISGAMMYTFYIEEGRGHVLSHSPCHRTIIIEDDSTSPQIAYYKKEYSNPLKWMFGLADHSSLRIMEIYVPTGTIIQNFNLDAK